MGVLDKLQFWKKEDDIKTLDTFKPFANDPMQQNQTRDPFAQQSDSFSQPNPFQMNNQFDNLGSDTVQQQNPFQQVREMPTQATQHMSQGHELELISSKLDALKANLDAINQRLINLERLAQEPPRKGW